MADVDIGALSGRIELDDRMTPTLEVAGHAVDKFDESFGGMGQRVAEQATAFFTAEAAIKAVEEVLHLGVEAIKELTIEGATVADVSENFDHLNAGAGRLGATLLGALSEGTHNTIDDFELMKIANQDLSAGMNLTDQQFKTLADGAFALAQATGGDVKTALDTMNDAMLTGRTRAIELQFGKINLADAEDRLAKSLGTTSDRLTADEKIQAARQAILEKVTESTQRLGVQTDGLDEKIAQASTVWKNFTDELGKTVATSPVLAAGFDGIRDALKEAFGGSQQDIVKTIANLIDEAAIGVLNFGKYVSDGVGLAARVFFAAAEVLVTIEQGIRAITYAVEYLLVGLMKVANFLSGGLAFNDWIAATEKDLDRLYSSMAEGQNQIAGFRKSADEWSVSTGHVDEAIDKVVARMEAAKKAAAEAKEPTDALGTSESELAKQGEAVAAAHDKVGATIRMTKEEAKKMADALAEIASAGTTAKATISTIDPVLLEHVKVLMAAGVSATALSTAYGLTSAQLKALTDVMKDEKDAAELEAKQMADSETRWAQYYQLRTSMSGTATQKEVADIKVWEAQQIQSHERAKTDTADFYTWLGQQSRLMYAKEEQDRLESDTHSKAHFEKMARDAKDAYDFAASHADQFTSEYIRDLQQTSIAAQQAADSWRSSMGAAIDDTIGKVRTLSGEWMSVADFAKKQQAGFSVQGDTIDQFTIDHTKGGADALLKELEAITGRLSYEKAHVSDWQSQNIYFADLSRYNALRSAYDLLKSQAKGFSEGGIGDFGTGTLAMLHGNEAVIPLNSGAAASALGGGGVTNYFYVNGTAADVARQVSAEIMRSLKQTRQYGAA